LAAAGDVVEFLGLVDSYPPKEAADVEEAGGSMADLSKLLMKFGAAADVLQNFTSPDDIEIEALRDHCNDQVLLIIHLLKLARGYRPRGSDLAAHLFAAEPNNSALARWESHVGRLLIHPVGGTHHTILQEPHLTRLLNVMAGMEKSVFA
jgi:thioesterase domain-containing protein